MNEIPDVRNLPVSQHAMEVPEQQAQPERKAQAVQLIELALAKYDLGLSSDGTAYARPKSGPRQHIALPLRGGSFGLRAALGREYFATTGKVAGNQALADMLNTLEGYAQDMQQTDLHLRVASSGSTLWVDLGDEAGNVVAITRQGWTVVPDAPVLFQRSALTAPMRPPSEGKGDLLRLFEFLNVSAADRPLLLAALVAAFLPSIPHPIPTFAGEQGTGKSSAAKMVVQLLDPSTVPLRKAPRDADSLVTALQGSWVAALDNLSTIPDWLSDSLCRAVTGDGDVRRKLYTDGALAVFSYRRQLILTGIDFAGLHGDLAERMLMIQLETISNDARVDEGTLWRQWESALPAIQAGLFTLTAQVLATLPTVELDSMPRMADYARVLAAIDQLMGSEGLARYTAQAAEIAADTLTADPFTESLQEKCLDFTGTAAELLERMTPIDPEWRPPRGWPKNARTVTGILKRAAPALRKNGWIVNSAGEDRNHTKLWHIQSPPTDLRP